MYASHDDDVVGAVVEKVAFPAGFQALDGLNGGEVPEELGQGPRRLRPVNLHARGGSTE